MFSPEARVHMVKLAISNSLDNADAKRIEVSAYSGWTADIISRTGCEFIIRGVRNQMDWAYEEELEQYFRDTTSADTIYLRPETIHSRTSSTLVRQYIESNRWVIAQNYLPEGVYDYILNGRRSEQ